MCNNFHLYYTKEIEKEEQKEEDRDEFGETKYIPTRTPRTRTRTHPFSIISPAWLKVCGHTIPFSLLCHLPRHPLRACVSPLVDVEHAGWLRVRGLILGRFNNCLNNRVTSSERKMFSRATSFASRRTSFAARSLSTSTTTDYQALIMGAPGSGKGTISKRMVAKFGMEVRHPPYLFSPVNLFFSLSTCQLH